MNNPIIIATINPPTAPPTAPPIAPFLGTV